MCVADRQPNSFGQTREPGHIYGLNLEKNIYRSLILDILLVIVMSNKAWFLITKQDYKNIVTVLN